MFIRRRKVRIEVEHRTLTMPVPVSHATEPPVQTAPAPVGVCLPAVENVTPEPSVQEAGPFRPETFATKIFDSKRFNNKEIR